MLRFLRHNVSKLSLNLKERKKKWNIAHNFYIYVVDSQTSDPFHVSRHIYIPKAKSIHGPTITDDRMDQFLRSHPFFHIFGSARTRLVLCARGGNAITLGVINARKRIRTRKFRPPLLLFQTEEASLLVGIHVKDVAVAAGDG